MTCPQEATKEILLEIIFSCDGNMAEIEKRVAELWATGVDNDWKPILSRTQKVVKAIGLEL